MPLLQALVRCSITALFLGFCLQLVTGQNEDHDNRKPLIVRISPIPGAKVNETSEIRCNVSTELRECMPIKFYIVTSPKTDCSQFFDYQACICPDDSPRNFYWNICSQRSVYVACVAEAINDSDICKEAVSVVPTGNNRSYGIARYSVR